MENRFVHPTGGTRCRRKKFLLPASAATLLLATALILIFRPGRALRPNIILISFDTLRADRLGCYGCPAGTSPHIDAFSRDSVQFTRAISQAPSTSTSHMSLFTGLLPPVHRVSSWLRDPEKAQRFDLCKLGAGIPTLALYLKENGYRTIGLHGGGHVSAFFGFDRGFDLYSDKRIYWAGLHENPAPLDIIVQSFPQTHREKRPLFLFLHTYICHDPYVKAPREIRERFLPDPEPGLPVAPAEGKTDFWDAHRSFWKAIDGGNEAHRRHVRALYDSGVGYADWIFGEIVTRLKRAGLYDQALIAVISDHGEEFWEHGDTLHKDLFIETLHVPLLVKFPGGEYGGKKIEARVAQFDLMPTLLHYLRIKPRLKLQARSLLPWIQGERTPPPNVISFDDSLQFVHFYQGDFVFFSGARYRPGNWLFDTVKDPLEQKNLATRQPQRVRQMRLLGAKIIKDQEMMRSRIGQGAPKPGRLPEDLRKQLKALGYL